MEKIKKKVRPAKKISSPNAQDKKMDPEPVYERENPKFKLLNKVVIITGGDSGIGKAVALLFAENGAKLVLVYNKDVTSARELEKNLEQAGSPCLLIRKDISIKKNCISVIDATIKKFGRIDILINNAAVQFPQKNLADITERHLIKTFAVNIFSQFFLVQAAEKFLKKGAVIINTTSVTAYRGSEHLIDYSSTKGAILSWTKALSAYFVKKGIRVNAVAPGPVWTPLIPLTFSPSEVASFGSDVPMGRAGQPVEIAPAYLFLASDDSSYVTGQVIHVNGGEIVNG